MSGRRIDYFDAPDAPRATRIVPGVSVAVINDRRQLLMIRRTDNNQWAIPGGAQEVGETPLEAARREVREETGIICEITGLVGIFSSPRNVIEFTSDGEVRQEFSILFGGYPRSEDLAVSSESCEVGWYERDDVLDLPMTPAQRRRIEYLVDFDGKPYLE
jgi:8-oxo-dGTP pyrophosphatase MutT (NUDIX family)